MTISTKYDAKLSPLRIYNQELLTQNDNKPVVSIKYHPFANTILKARNTENADLTEIRECAQELALAIENNIGTLTESSEPSKNNTVIQSALKQVIADQKVLQKYLSSNHNTLTHKQLTKFFRHQLKLNTEMLKAGIE